MNIIQQEQLILTLRGCFERLLELWDLDQVPKEIQGAEIQLRIYCDGQTADVAFQVESATATVEGITTPVERYYESQEFAAESDHRTYHKKYRPEKHINGSEYSRGVEHG